MHILVVIAHPNQQSFSHAIAQKVIDGAKDKGHTVKTLDLYQIGFNPILTKRDLEQFEGVKMPDDVLEHQRLVEEAEGIFFIFPVWWYGMPAMMKGWLDRVWSAGWAYHWKHDPEGSLLDHRPCTILALTGASSNQLNRWSYDKQIHHLWRYGVFGYCGFDPLRITILEDCAFDGSGKHRGHLEAAFRAGQQIGSDPEATPGIRCFLDHGLDHKGEKFIPR
ncbi:flavodoxin-like protein [Exophiala viscosa]|uniref:Flavodoxin-like protein n=1 Tax=Exophiala viscosa TaxID=2486360 RepID=A0AAN6E4L9_9EURO|nr:flavodoxin-like protein [Exophiala viscosa]KAI1629396.1 flavodoxin-like protein [Exophiala viscosa]